MLFNSDLPSASAQNARCMPWFYRLSIALLCSLLLACSHAPLLPVAQFTPLAQSELLTIHRGEHTLAFTARVESDGQTLRVVAISPTGQRLFSLTRVGDQLTTEAGPWWPKFMPLDAVWRDFEISHAPLDAVLPAHWQRHKENGVTHWWYRGKKYAEVRHSAGKIELKRPEYGLSIEVLPE